MLNKNVITRIYDLKKAGASYREIAECTNVSIDQVKYLFRGGYKQIENDIKILSSNFCYCGAPINRSRIGRPKKYCCGKCRHQDWVKRNRNKYTFFCKQCGNRFISHQKNKIFCSKSCAAKYLKENKDATAVI